MSVRKVERGSTSSSIALSLTTLPFALTTLIEMATTAEIASDLLSGQQLAHLLPPSWKEEIPKWFAEDTPSFDWAGFVVGESEQEAFLWGKSGVSPLPLSRGSS